LETLHDNESTNKNAEMEFYVFTEQGHFVNKKWNLRKNPNMPDNDYLVETRVQTIPFAAVSL